MLLSQKYINRWLDKRIPPATEFQLDHNTIFIFAAKFGGLFLLLCLLLFLLGTNYQNNLMLLLCYFLLALLLTHLLASYRNFSRLTIRLGKLSEVFAGDDVALPVWINPESAPAVHGIVNINFMGQDVQHWLDCDNYNNPVNIELHCPRRGYQAIPRVTFSSYYPLGLFKCWTHLAFAQQILVYPAPRPCPLVLTSKASEQGEQSQSGQQISLANNDEFSHLKTYSAGEPLRHVAWKQLAKGRGMLSKIFSQEQQHSGWLVLPPGPASQLETQLGQLCFQVIEFSRQSAHFGLQLGDIVIPPSSGETHRLNCLHALAIYQSEPSAMVDRQ